MKLKLMTLLAIISLAFASCNSDNNSDEDMDSLVNDTTSMGDGTIEPMADTTAFPDTSNLQSDTNMTDPGSPIQ